MRHLTVAVLTVALLATMIAATVADSAVGTELARTEGYAQPDQSALDIAMAQLGSILPAR